MALDSSSTAYALMRAGGQPDKPGRGGTRGSGSVRRGLAASYADPAIGAAAAGAAPAVLAGIDYISATIGARRLEHAAETLSDAADEAGARTAEEFVEFLRLLSPIRSIGSCSPAH